MKLLITGSKRITDFDMTKYIPEDTECIITGENKGIEALAQKFADENNIEKHIFITENNAINKRNRSMVDEADAVLIFWDGKTKNTVNIADYASKKRKSLTVVFV